MKPSERTPYYARYNPAYGAKGEKLYAVFHWKEGICPAQKYATKREAQSAAKWFNQIVNKPFKR